MRKAILAAAVFVALAGCASAPMIPREESAELEDLRVKRDAKLVTWSQWASRVNEVSAKRLPASAQNYETRALLMVVAERVDGGKMTPAEANLALARSLSDAAFRQEQINTLSAARRPVTTNCTRVGSSVDCTTY